MNSTTRRLFVWSTLAVIVAILSLTLIFGPQEADAGIRERIHIKFKIYRILKHLKPRKLYTLPIPLLLPMPYKQAITPVILKKKEILPVVFPRPYPEPVYEYTNKQPVYEVPKDKYPIFWD